MNQFISRVNEIIAEKQRLENQAIERELTREQAAKQFNDEFAKFAKECILPRCEAVRDALLKNNIPAMCEMVAQEDGGPSVHFKFSPNLQSGETLKSFTGTAISFACDSEGKSLTVKTDHDAASRHRFDGVTPEFIEDRLIRFTRKLVGS